MCTKKELEWKILLSPGKLLCTKRPNQVILLDQDLLDQVGSLVWIKVKLDNLCSKNWRAATFASSREQFAIYRMPNRTQCLMGQWKPNKPKNHHRANPSNVRKMYHHSNLRRKTGRLCNYGKTNNLHKQKSTSIKPAEMASILVILWK